MGTILTLKLDRNEKIYRTIPKKWLFEMFETGKNALARPSLWDDPFENLLLRSLVNLNGETGRFSFANDLYGQCWTLQGYSDAMWRIYSPDKTGIRIRTTVGQLLDSLSGPDKTFDPVSCFIGKVQYLTEAKLNKFVSSHFHDGLGTDGRNIAETLLVKRNAFSHEKEVRVIYFSPSDTNPTHDLYFHDFDCHRLLDQIMVHPQLTDSEAEALKNEIRSKTGFKGKILHSQLYRLPKGFTVKIHAT